MDDLTFALSERTRAALWPDRWLTLSEIYSELDELLLVSVLEVSALHGLKSIAQRLRDSGLRRGSRCNGGRLRYGLCQLMTWTLCSMMTMMLPLLFEMHILRLDRASLAGSSART